jgi:hypothetical protein
VRTTLAVALSGLTLAALIPNPGAAQSHIQFTPGIGLYVPHGSSILDAPAEIGDRAGRSKKPVGGPVFSARLSSWLTSHFGLEATTSFSPALIAIRDSANRVQDVGQRLLLGSARSVLRLTPDASRALTFHLASGVGLVSRTGAAWKDTPLGGTALAMVIAAGGQTRLSNRPSNRVTFRFELEDYISWVDFEKGSIAELPPRVYHDLIWSLGIGVPIGR